MIMFSQLFCVLIYEAETAEIPALQNKTQGAGQLCFARRSFWTPDFEIESFK